MPSKKKQPIVLTSAGKMLYDSVDNYHPLGLEDNSVRMINQEDLNDFSSQSIVCAMDRFVKAVNNMNETIMVPCRLLDIEVNSQKPSPTTKVPKLLKAGGDPYSYYSILNSVKNDLIWGASTNDDDATTDNASLTPSINSTRWTGQETNAPLSKKQPIRRESTLSLASVSSEGDSEVGSESTEEDDGSSNMSEEGSSRGVAATNNVTDTLRMHLFGLHSCLKNLTDTATYITDCYQEMVTI
ncbi:hypothetical protein SK128_025729 [Halocaridina rubra]|uniref:Mid1-interacting protein 1 n=1 Tax=Halocaridina rubra TaxID=373956 RepID=A0AAN8XGA4_HALRR